MVQADVIYAVENTKSPFSLTFSSDCLKLNGCIKKNNRRVAQQVKELTLKPDDPSSVPKTYNGKRREQSPACSPYNFTNAVAHGYTHTHTHTYIYRQFINLKKCLVGNIFKRIQWAIKTQSFLIIILKAVFTLGWPSVACRAQHVFLFKGSFSCCSPGATDISLAWPVGWHL